MNASIKTKLLTMCILLVLVVTLSISSTYYVLTRHDKQRESKQRIRIAFDIILNDFDHRTETSLTRFREFLRIVKFETHCNERSNSKIFYNERV